MSNEEFEQLKRELEDFVPQTMEELEAFVDLCQAVNEAIRKANADG